MSVRRIALLSTGGTIEKTYDELRRLFPADADRYRHVVIPGYGHLDTVFGKHAAHDTYPAMLEHLNRVGA